MRNVLVTGGAGFIGVNTAIYFLEKGDKVTIYDNLSRKGSKKNLAYIKKHHPKITFINGDIRDFKSVKKAVAKADIVIHLAGQVAVTSSVINPRDDFEINILGTINVLEAARLSKNKPILIYSSTNKVYGGLDDLEIIEDTTRYRFKNLPFGVSEERNLDFHSPYGCSKGAADQYVRDYHRIYGLRTITFRQSCIYGPFQHGVEDQGWVAWFIIALAQKKNITIYGNGKQVRDLLHVADLVKAYDQAIEHIDHTQGQIYNIGGGRDNTLSVWLEFQPLLESLFKRKIKTKFDKWRPGDQPIFIADIRRAYKHFDWRPKINTTQGIEQLYLWINKHTK